MTETVTTRVDPVDSTTEANAVAVGAAPTETSLVNIILEDELVEDVSIDGMCGVY